MTPRSATTLLAAGAAVADAALWWRHPSAFMEWKQPLQTFYEKQLPRPSREAKGRCAERCPKGAVQRSGRHARVGAGRR